MNVIPGGHVESGDRNEEAQAVAPGPVHQAHVRAHLREPKVAPHNKQHQRQAVLDKRMCPLCHWCKKRSPLRVCVRERVEQTCAACARRKRRQALPWHSSLQLTRVRLNRRSSQSRAPLRTAKTVPVAVLQVGQPLRWGRDAKCSERMPARRPPASSRGGRLPRRWTAEHHGGCGARPAGCRLG